MHLSPRITAVYVLNKVINESCSLNDVLPSKKSKMDAAFGAQLQELCYGVCRYYFQLKAWVNAILTKPIRQKDSIIEILLLCGLYQLRYSSVPAPIVVNESVAGLDALKRPFAKGLVNACLRRALREPELLEALFKDVMVKTAHPRWLIEKMSQAYPQDKDKILDANNQRPPFTLRVDTKKISRVEMIAQLSQLGMEAHPHPWVETAITLEAATSVTDLPGFSEGHVSVQDAASQCAARLLPLSSGISVLDACSAPGGKTIHLLQNEPTLSLLAIDKDAKRLIKLNENLKRAEVHATVECCDVMDTNAWWDGQGFHRILLDAPCSATGIIRRHPDIKLLRRENDIASLADMQYQLLTSLSQLLLPGGYLLYSTCSIMPAENVEVVSRFLNAESSFQEVKNAYADVGVPEIMQKRSVVGMQILPGEDGMDGFYYALLQKK